MLPTLAPCAAALSPLTADVTGDVGGGEANLELPDLSGVVVGLGLGGRALLAPAAALPVGDGTFFVFGVDGEVHSFSAVSGQDISMDLRGRVDSHVADACWLSEAEFTMADPVARSVDFYDRESLRHLASWSPPEGDMLFEPVGISRYANWLAVADRGNGRVYLLDAVSRREFFFAEVPMPRDIE